jgi:hypothetical protein
MNKDKEYGYLQFDNPAGSVTVTGYEGNLIIVSGKRRYNSDNTSNRGSLNKIDQPGFSLSAEEKDNNVLIITESFGNTIDFDIKVPSYMSLKLKCIENGKVSVYSTRGDIEITNDFGEIFAGDISGSAILNSTYGDITVAFKKIYPDKPSMFTSFEGDIELLLPPDAGANFKMRSPGGEILSQLELQTQSRKARLETNEDIKSYTLESWSRAEMNGGGAELIISSYSGNIILRNKKDVTFKF